MSNLKGIEQEFTQFIIETLTSTAARNAYPFDVLLKDCPAAKNKYLYLLSELAKKAQGTLLLRKSALESEIEAINEKIAGTAVSLQSLLCADTRQQRASIKTEVDESRKMLLSALEDSQRNIMHVAALKAGIHNGRDLLKELPFLQDLNKTLEQQFESDLVALKASNNQYRKQLDSLINPERLSVEQLEQTIAGKIQFFKDLLATLEENKAIAEHRLLKVTKDVETIEKVSNTIN